MNKLATAIERVRGKLAAKADSLLFDLCDIHGPTVVDGGSGGDSVTIGLVATNVNCSYKGLGRSVERVVGGRSYVANHRLKFTRTITTVALTPKHVVKVHPRGKTGQLIFEHPFIVEDSQSPFLLVDASLVKQGYQT